MDNNGNNVGGWIGSGIGLVIGLAVFVIGLIAYVSIIRKAGYSGWWVLVAFVPVLNLVMFLVFAFSRWPVLRELDTYRAGRGTPQRY